MNEVAPQVRTYKLRRGRITDGQRRALATLSPSYGIELGSGFDQDKTFGRRAPLILDIGFGMGETTVTMAAADPDRDVIAVDVHTPGAGALLSALEDRGISNVRVVVGDARDVLASTIAAGSLDEIRVYFPDPWPKVKHRKRRLVDATFVSLAARALHCDGVLHCATDCAPYAASMLRITAAEVLLVPTTPTDADGFALRPSHRPVTRFERQGLAKGHQVFDVVCRRAC